jgi:hypothetical protein
VTLSPSSTQTRARIERNGNTGHVASPVTADIAAYDRLAAILGPQTLDALEAYVDARIAGAVDKLQSAGNAEPEWVTLAQAGQRLGCSADAVRMRANRGRVETKHVGRRLYVLRASIDR